MNTGIFILLFRGAASNETGKITEIVFYLLPLRSNIRQDTTVNNSSTVYGDSQDLSTPSVKFSSSPSFKGIDINTSLRSPPDFNVHIRFLFSVLSIPIITTNHIDSNERERKSREPIFNNILPYRRGLYGTKRYRIGR